MIDTAGWQYEAEISCTYDPWYQRRYRSIPYYHPMGRKFTPLEEPRLQGPRNAIACA